MFRYVIKLNQRIYSNKLLINKKFNGSSATTTTTTAASKFSKENINWENALPYEKIPGPYQLPIIGAAHHFLFGGKFHNLSMTQVNKKIYDEYGDIAKLGGIPGKYDFVLLFDPDDIEYIYRTEGKWPNRRALDSITYYRKNIRPDIFKETGGLMVEKDEKWQEVRSKVNPIMMQPKIIQCYTESIDEISFEFIERVKKILDEKMETPADFMNELNKFSLESVCWIAMEKKLGSFKDDGVKDLDIQKFIESVHSMFEFLYKLDVLPSLWKFYPTSDYKKFIELSESMTNTTMKYIDEAITRIESQENTRKDDSQIGVLEKIYKIDRNVAIVMALDMLMAGVDTTSGAISTIIYLLAKNPEKQEILRNEIKSVLPSKDDKITSDILKNRVPYLKACIKEALRIHPVAATNLRAAGKNLVIKGYKIPKGTDILMAISVLQNEEKHFKRSKEYIPERWLRSNEMSDISAKNTHPFVYLPFGFGSRTCVGKRFAELEIEIIVSRLIRNFKIEWHYPDIKYGNKMLNVPCGDLKYKLIKIDD